MDADDMLDGDLMDIQFDRLDQMRSAFADLTSLARGFGQAMSSALTSAIARGRDLGDVLRTLALRLSSLVLSRSLHPLERGIGQAFGSLSAGLMGGLGVRPFARGGIVGGPTLFGLAGGQLGLMGEAGPEAVLPLSRGRDGRLGVQAGGGGAVSVTMNITSPDAQSFIASQRQVTSALARAVQRGRRGL